MRVPAIIGCSYIFRFPKSHYQELEKLALLAYLLLTRCYLFISTSVASFLDVIIKNLVVTLIYTCTAQDANLDRFS